MGQSLSSSSTPPPGSPHPQMDGGVMLYFQNSPLSTCWTLIHLDYIKYICSRPGSLYSSVPVDFSPSKLKQLILSRRLCPFYTGYSEVSDIPLSPVPGPPVSRTLTLPNLSSSSQQTQQEQQRPAPPLLNKKKSSTLYNNSNSTVPSALEDLYKDPIECPICFLVQPFLFFFFSTFSI